MKNLIMLVFILLFHFASAQTDSAKLIKSTSRYPEKIEVVMTKLDQGKEWSDIFREWLLALAAVAGIVSTTIAIWKSLKEFRLKLEAEKRIAQSEKVETD